MSSSTEPKPKSKKVKSAVPSKEEVVVQPVVADPLPVEVKVEVPVEVKVEVEGEVERGPDRFRLRPSLSQPSSSSLVSSSLSFSSAPKRTHPRTLERSGRYRSSDVEGGQSETCSRRASAAASERSTTGEGLAMVSFFF